MVVLTVTRSFFGVLGRYVARYRRAAPIRLAARCADRLLDRYANLNYDPLDNGEAFVLRTLARFPVRQVVDVGANVGGWTALAHRYLPAAHIHSFEVLPDTAEQLRRNVGHLPNVSVRAVGLSDSEARLSFNVYEGLSAITTAFDYPHPIPPAGVIEAPVTTLDHLVRSHGIDQIGLLKIDVEGMELEVIRGAREAIAAGRVLAIQFEYGRLNIITKHLLRDFYLLLEEQGFVVGKIYPNYVDFRGYRLAD